MVLVPSGRRASEWEPVADIVTAADGIEGTVGRLQSGEHVGLVVLINKYDGIDLPNDACRVLVVDGLPEAYGGIDRREALLLGESDAMVSRQLQRIEQGMGRGVRSAEDHCAVLLLGPKLTQLIAEPANLARLGPATRIQLELSSRVAQQLAGGTLDEIIAAVRQSLDRDPGWVKASRQALAGVTYGSARLDPVAVHLREAFNAAATGQYRPAATAISDAVNAADDDRVKGLAAGTACLLHTPDRSRPGPADPGWCAQAQPASPAPPGRCQLQPAVPRRRSNPGPLPSTWQAATPTATRSSSGSKPCWMTSLSIPSTPMSSRTRWSSSRSTWDSQPSGPSATPTMGLTCCGRSAR